MVRSWYKHSRFPEENAKRFTVPNAFVAAEDSTDYTSTMGTKTVLSSIYQSPPPFEQQCLVRAHDYYMWSSF